MKGHLFTTGPNIADHGAVGWRCWYYLGGCLELSVLSIEQKEKSPELINQPEAPRMLDTCKVSLLRAKRQGEQAMNNQRAAVVAIIVISIALVSTFLITRKNLCEIRIRTGQTEVAVFMAYES